MELPLEQICSSVSVISSTLNAQIWHIIGLSLSKYWYLITPSLFIWILIEISVKGKSRNNFSPFFNSFVGSGTYFIFFNLFMVLPSKIFGGMVFCVPFPYVGHLIIFVLVGIFLRMIGFWVY